MIQSFFHTCLGILYRSAGHFSHRMLRIWKRGGDCPSFCQATPWFQFQHIIVSNPSHCQSSNPLIPIQHVIVSNPSHCQSSNPLISSSTYGSFEPYPAYHTPRLKYWIECKKITTVTRSMTDGRLEKTEKLRKDSNIFTLNRIKVLVDSIVNGKL